MPKYFVLIGAVGGFLAVALGAFGAHALKSRLDSYYLDVWSTAVDYQMYHSLAMLLVAILLMKWPGTALLNTAAYAFCAGIVIFSGSLYLLCLTGTKWLGAITPIGGVAFLVGWACLALATFRQSSS